MIIQVGSERQDNILVVKSGSTVICTNKVMSMQFVNDRK